MRKSIFTLLLSLICLSMWAVDWTGVAFLNDVSGGQYANLYKCTCTAGTAIIENIQKPGAEAGIYVHFPAAGIVVEGLTSTQYRIEGAGMWMYLSAFTAQETTVNITYANGSATLAIYYANGTTGGGGGTTPDPTPEPDPSACTTVNWDTYSFIGNGTEAANTNCFKTDAAGQTGVQEVVNIQHPGFASENGIYLVFTTPPTAMTIDGSPAAYAIQGAGVCFYLSNLTRKETAVVVTLTGGNTITLHFYNEQGTCSSPSGTSITVRFRTPEGLTFWDYNTPKYVLNKSLNPQGGVFEEAPLVNGWYVYSCQAGNQIVFLNQSQITHDAQQTVVVAPTQDMCYELSNGTTSSHKTLTPVSCADTPENEPQRCHYSGGAGSGQTNNGETVFAQGYHFDVWMNSTLDTVFVEATDEDVSRLSDNAVFRYYPYLDPTLSINEWQMQRVGTSQTYKAAVPVTFFSNKDDGMIRCAVKFEYPGLVSVSTPEYFYLDGGGCAERAKREFIIYHHNEVPDTAEEGSVTSYEGGKILQPIQYKRLLTPNVWETFCVPFEVQSVTVYYPEENREYNLYAQYIDPSGTIQPGYFYLREFTTPAVVRDDFQPNWHDIHALNSATALPQKNVPYIIQAPDQSMANHYIVFHGEGYQTIDSDYQKPTLPADGYFSYSGNNTMRSTVLSSAYTLEADGLYFVSDGVNTLYPFECSVNATQSTIARFPRLGLNHSTETTTALTTPTTLDLSRGDLYSPLGLLMGHFDSEAQYHDLLLALPAGFYLVRTASQTTKIYWEVK